MASASEETFLHSVKPESTIRGRLRQFARNRTLDVLSGFRPAGERNFVRFLYAHYVFDDQRREFDRLISTLRNIGHFVSTPDAVAMLKGDVPVDGRYFHLSFDDGLRCVARNALPVLKQHGAPAIMFVNSALAEDPSAETRRAWEAATGYAHPLDVMSWADMAEAVDAGFEIGAHTSSHARLSAISADDARLEQEIVDCKQEIERNLGRPCPYFAWPYGKKSDIDRKSLSIIKNAGFEAAFGVFREPVRPSETDPYKVPRHHFEPQWPLHHISFFAWGGLERNDRAV